MPRGSPKASAASGAVSFAEIRRFMKGIHPWRAGETVQLGEGFDKSKVQHILEHVDSDYVDTAPEVSCVALRACACALTTFC